MKYAPTFRELMRTAADRRDNAAFAFSYHPSARGVYQPVVPSLRMAPRPLSGTRLGRWRVARRGRADTPRASAREGRQRQADFQLQSNKSDGGGRGAGTWVGSSR